MCMYYIPKGAESMVISNLYKISPYPRRPSALPHGGKGDKNTKPPRSCPRGPIKGNITDYLKMTLVPFSIYIPGAGFPITFLPKISYSELI